MLAEAVSELKKFFCHCVLEDDTEAFLVMKAYDESQASRLIHQGYKVMYVLDIMTPLQMEYRKRHLQPSLFHVQALTR